ncbi:MAG: VOC family protein [Candidatus Marinimicrobia bacterium]|nr:VOC family protein [Candidatus Neomarinimicrobiota bacterium]MCF7829236.1 VOC family protein [Candidatus Neomarinimicrobiota bacterium]MCF7881111.1 VOC family protein [Candidatus Neomarinimicrobiota bacterium]
MQFHQGRLIDHVHIRVSDLERSKEFYRRVLRSVGRKITSESPHHFAADELFVTADKEPTNNFHLAFQAASPEMVQRFYSAGLEAGGQDNGAPGERSQYHPGYYGAYILDPDGNNIEAVYHGPAERSADSVVITAAMQE